MEVCIDLVTTDNDPIKELISAIQHHRLDNAVEMMNSTLFSDLFATCYIHKQSTGVGDLLCKYEDVYYCLHAISRAEFAKPFSIIESIKRASGIVKHPFYTHVQIPEHWNERKLWPVSKFIHNCTLDLEVLRKAMKDGRPLVLK